MRKCMCSGMRACLNVQMPACTCACNYLHVIVSVRVCLLTDMFKDVACISLRLRACVHALALTLAVPRMAVPPR